MVSVISALRNVRSARGHQSRSSLYIRGLIPQNQPRQFRLMVNPDNDNEIVTLNYLELRSSYSMSLQEHVHILD